MDNQEFLCVRKAFIKICQGDARASLILSLLLGPQQNLYESLFRETDIGSGYARLEALGFLKNDKGAITLLMDNIQKAIREEQWRQ